MLIWARNLESKYDNSENLLNEFKFTNVSINNVRLVVAQGARNVTVARYFFGYFYFVRSGDEPEHGVEFPPTQCAMPSKFGGTWGTDISTLDSYCLPCCVRDTAKRHK